MSTRPITFNKSLLGFPPLGNCSHQVHSEIFAPSTIHCYDIIMSHRGLRTADASSYSAGQSNTHPRGNRQELNQIKTAISGQQGKPLTVCRWKMRQRSRVRRAQAPGETQQRRNRATGSAQGGKEEKAREKKRAEH